jgi:hypothetical protein
MCGIIKAEFRHLLLEKDADIRQHDDLPIVIVDILSNSDYIITIILRSVARINIRDIQEFIVFCHSERSEESRF